MQPNPYESPIVAELVEPKPTGKSIARYALRSVRAGFLFAVVGGGLWIAGDHTAGGWILAIGAIGAVLEACVVLNKLLAE